MKYLIFISLILPGIFLIPGCVVQQHATTIEPDKDSGCVIHMVIQIGIDGRDSDVVNVRSQLEPCFSIQCPIPCPYGKSGGCKVMTNVIVKKWSDLSADEKNNFHHITMVDNDGLPSNAFIGKANNGASSGTWRRNEGPRTYCHETLHLLGLRDQYCSRIFCATDSTIITEVVCDPPPDPAGGNCCTPTASFKRCGTVCSGHEHDLMATLEPELTCQNILDVLKKAGMDKCPDACCSGTIYRHPYNNLYLGGGYYNFGDKDIKFGTYGLTGEYDHLITPKIGLTLDAGYFTRTKNDSGYKQTDRLLNINAGISYYPNLFKSTPNTRLSTHLLVGVTDWMQKASYNGMGGSSNNQLSFNASIGAAIDWKLSSSLYLRLPQLDYMPTFFASSMQNNFRISGGISFGFNH